MNYKGEKKRKRIMLLAQLEKVWDKYPELRLCQLIFNIAPGDNFYLKDGDFYKLMERYNQLTTNKMEDENVNPDLVPTPEAEEAVVEETVEEAVEEAVEETPEEAPEAPAEETPAE